MKEGKIVQHGTPQEIYHQPKDEYVAGLFGKYNLLKPGIAALFGISVNDKNKFMRPEEFTISTIANGGAEGTIKRISFWGSFYEAEVIINAEKIIVRTPLKELYPGEKVFVSVNK